MISEIYMIRTKWGNDGACATEIMCSFKILSFSQTKESQSWSLNLILLIWCSNHELLIGHFHTRIYGLGQNPWIRTNTLYLVFGSELVGTGQRQASLHNNWGAIVSWTHLCPHRQWSREITPQSFQLLWLQGVLWWLKVCSGELQNETA